MKNIYWPFCLVLLSHSVWADQTTFLAIARDSYLQSSFTKIQEYCEANRPDLPLDQNFIFICGLQIKADCSHGKEELQATACAAEKRVKELEQMILISDKNIAQFKHVPIGEQIFTPEKYLDLVRSTDEKWVKRSLPDVNKIDDKDWQIMGKPNKKELQKVAVELEKAKAAVNALELDQSCDSNDDCELYFYGADGCHKGREGYLALRKKTLNSEMMSTFGRYHEVSERASRVWGDNVMCTAEMRYYSAICQKKLCVGKISYSE